MASSGMKPTQIISRGKPEDRRRLAAIAQLEETSGSDVVIKLIRQRYTELFGEAPLRGE